MPRYAERVAGALALVTLLLYCTTNTRRLQCRSVFAYIGDDHCGLKLEMCRGPADAEVGRA